MMSSERQIQVLTPVVAAKDNLKLAETKGHPLQNKKISIKINVATNKGNSQNEIWHWTKDEIGVTVESWLWFSSAG